jgi:hypothetical protein
MTTLSVANNAMAKLRQTHGASGWLGLAASPTFALMAWNEAHSIALCSSASHTLPIGGMTAMYLLMSLFHLPSWLKLAPTRTVIKGD